jgi:hypothetical protein
MTKEDIELSAVSEYINSSLSLSSVAKKYGYTGGWLLKKLNAKGIRPRGRADWKLNVEKGYVGLLTITRFILKMR